MSSFDEHQLKLALAHHLVTTVVTADGQIAPGEARYLDLLFPAEVMRAEGFVAQDGSTTPRLAEALSEALLVQPRRMSLSDKLELVTMCMDAALSDDQADSYELVHVRVAARVLGVTDDQLDAHLAVLPTVGEVDSTDLLDDD